MDYTTPEIQLDNADPEFARGAQVGVLYGILASRPEQSVCYIVDRLNVENVLRIAEGLHRPFRTDKECGDGCHLEFRFEAATVSA